MSSLKMKYVFTIELGFNSSLHLNGINCDTAIQSRCVEDNVFILFENKDTYLDIMPRLHFYDSEAEETTNFYQFLICAKLELFQR